MAAFQIIEHCGDQKITIESYYLGSYNDTCDYLNRRYSDYGCHVRGADLKEAIDRYGGYAWLYFDFFEVEIIQVM